MPNRNVESHFSLLPNIGIERSKFDRSHSVKTTFNVGDLIPVYLDEVLPGDSFDISTSKVVRLQTPITPFMSNLYLDTYFFYTPSRLLWEHWRELNGENTQSAWVPETVYQVPQVVSPDSTGWTKGSLADYFGIPTGITDLSVSALPFRAYALICQEFFRDENLTQPINIPVDDTEVAGSNGDNYITDLIKGGMPFKVSKFHDYFTSALPFSQKGNSIPIPVAFGEGSGLAPVFGNEFGLGMSDGTVMGSIVPNTVFSGQSYYNRFPKASAFDNNPFQEKGVIVDNILNSEVTSKSVTGLITKEQAGEHPEYSGLYADLSNTGFSVEAGSINDLRIAFQMQKALEKDARGGTRYIEMIKSHFNVSNPDYRLQRPEYLGGNRIPLNVNSVSANSGSENQPLGTQGAYSMTLDSHDDFFQSFTEHGYIIGLAVVRYDHTYQQGLDKLWTRKNRFDFYLPVFAHIGEQPIYNYQIFAQGDSVVDEDGNIIDNQVFGYQEAWAEYRYKNNFVTGEMRSNVDTSLDIWHLADDYAELPTLSDGWIREDKNTVDRVLTVTSSNADQLFMDMYINCYATRPMPVYSVPGLIDHF